MLSRGSGLHIKKLLLSLMVCLGAGGIGTYYTLPSINNWYRLLQKPVFTPPNWVFGPVWTGLYILMGIALYIVWQKEGLEYQNKVASYIWFGIQLVLNVLWSATFFGHHSIFGGLIIIVVLWLSIAITISEFSKQATIAAWLLMPYLLWVTYAGALNYSFWRLNG